MRYTKSIANYIQPHHLNEGAKQWKYSEVRLQTYHPKLSSLKTWDLCGHGPNKTELADRLPVPCQQNSELP